MIRNAVLHLFNEQPLVADLYRLPQADDVGLVCTNLRLMNGNRPVFIDDIRSTFFFPYGQIRFVEIPAAAMAAAGEVSPPEVPAGAPAAGPDGGEEVAAEARADGSADAGSGRRGGPGREAETAPQPAPDGEAEPETELELDEEFLRRIREV